MSSLTTAEQIAEQQAVGVTAARGSTPPPPPSTTSRRPPCSPRRSASAADVIVVGNRRMQGVGRLLGSVANEVAHNAPCDVFIVKTV